MESLSPVIIKSKMRKTYKSNSNISISVQLKSKAVRVSFDPVTGQGSEFTTEDAELQKAIEKHYRCGELFSVHDDPVKTENKTSTAPVSPITKVKVSGQEDAVEYLASNFGISRTKLKTTEAIHEAAKSNQIEFEGL